MGQKPHPPIVVFPLPILVGHLVLAGLKLKGGHSVLIPGLVLTGSLDQADVTVKITRSQDPVLNSPSILMQGPTVSGHRPLTGIR